MKTLYGRSVAGPNLAMLASAYVDALNDGKTPTISTAWERVVEQTLEDAVKTGERYAALRSERAAVLRALEVAEGDEALEEREMQAVHEASVRGALEAFAATAGAGGRRRGRRGRRRRRRRRFRRRRRAAVPRELWRKIGHLRRPHQTANDALSEERCRAACEELFGPLGRRSARSARPSRRTPPWTSRASSCRCGGTPRHGQAADRLRARPRPAKWRTLAKFASGDAHALGGACGAVARRLDAVIAALKAAEMERSEELQRSVARREADASQFQKERDAFEERSARRRRARARSRGCSSCWTPRRRRWSASGAATRGSGSAKSLEEKLEAGRRSTARRGSGAATRSRGSRPRRRSGCRR